MGRSHQSVWDHAHHLKRSADPFPSLPRSSLGPPPTAQRNPRQLLVTMNVLPILVTLHTDFHYACSVVTGSFHLVWHLQGVPMYRICQEFLPSFSWILFHCVDVLHSAYSSTSWWTFGLFPHLALRNNSILNVCVQVFGWTYAFISLGYGPGKVMMVHLANWCLAIRETGRLVSRLAASFSIMASRMMRVWLLHLFTNTCN